MKTISCVKCDSYLVFILVNVLRIKSYCLHYKMTTRQLNIKNKTYYFYNDMINVLHFKVNNLKLEEKKHGKTSIFILLVMLIKSLIGMSIM